MQFDPEQPYVGCYGRADGAKYFQNGAYFRANGEVVSTEKVPDVKQKALEHELSLAYSAEALEDIGKTQGMDGLRSIAEPLGVKGRSKQELITEILAAQANAKVE